MNALLRQPILSQFKNLTFVLVGLGCAMLFFDLQLWMMWNLPGNENEMCVMGAGLKLSNIVYAIVMSLMFGIFLVGFWQTLREKQASYGSFSLSTLAMAIGSLTVICASCTFQAISIAGFAIGLHFFTELNAWIKLLSLGFMAFGLYQVNQQLKNECSRCVK